MWGGLVCCLLLGLGIVVWFDFGNLNFVWGFGGAGLVWLSVDMVFLGVDFAGVELFRCALWMV